MQMKENNGKLTLDQYNDLKKFLSVYISYVGATDNLPIGGDIFTVMEEMEKKSLAQAKTGLMMAINDSIEMSSDWDGEKIRKFDSLLKEKNISTLSELRLQYSKKYARIMKRGKINSIGDYYHMKGILDGSPEILNTDEFAKLSQMIVDYEQK